MFGAAAEKAPCRFYCCKQLFLVPTASECAKVQAWEWEIWLHSQTVILLVQIQGIQTSRKQQLAGICAVAFIWGVKVWTQTKIFFLVCITTIRDLLIGNSCLQVLINLSDKQEEEYQKSRTSVCFLLNGVVSSLPWQQLMEQIFPTYRGAVGFSAERFCCPSPAVLAFEVKVV